MRGPAGILGAVSHPNAGGGFSGLLREVWLVLAVQFYREVGTAPLAEVPRMDRLSDLVALRHTSGRRWTTGTPGTPYRPVRAGSALEQFLAAYGTYDVVSIAFAAGSGGGRSLTCGGKLVSSASVTVS